ncbi:hypothetical protein Lesp01_76130 [Lentzea sp. NBRC 102530]|nr:hypothetical protein Lesp01_76130 [Lentzea sp. NBRC 102530]
MVLGRLVEVVSGQAFHDVLRERLIEPLRIDEVATDADEAVLHRTAVGHGADATPVTRWAVAYGTAPSGSHFAISARQLMEFVRLHLDEPALAAMRDDQGVEVPDFGNGAVGWGLGYMRYRGGVVGHTGVSKGQKAFLRVDAERKRAVAVLTNSVNSERLAHDVIDELMGKEPLPVPPEKPEPVDPRTMCGTYRDQLHDITLTTENGHGVLIYRPRTEMGVGRRVPVVRYGDNSIIATTPTADGYQVYSLLGDGRYLHNGAAAWRVTP